MYYFVEQRQINGQFRDCGVTIGVSLYTFGVALCPQWFQILTLGLWRCMVRMELENHTFNTGCQFSRFTYLHFWPTGTSESKARHQTIAFLKNIVFSIKVIVVLVKLSNFLTFHLPTLAWKDPPVASQSLRWNQNSSACIGYVSWSSLNCQLAELTTTAGTGDIGR